MDSSDVRYTGRRGLRRYTHRDYVMIKEWYELRGKKAPSPALLSDLGYIADDRVCGFLYLTNSNMAMIEGIIANPETVPSLRKESLTKLVGYMIDTALLLGYENIFGISKHPSMAKEAERFGFKVQSDNVIYTMIESDEAIDATDIDESKCSRVYEDGDEDY